MHTDRNWTSTITIILNCLWNTFPRRKEGPKNIFLRKGHSQGHMGIDLGVIRKGIIHVSGLHCTNVIKYFTSHFVSISTLVHYCFTNCFDSNITLESCCILVPLSGLVRKVTLWAFFFWDSRVDSSDSSSSKTRKVLTRVGLGSISIPTLHRAGVHHSEPLVLTAIAAKALGKWTRGSERGFTRELTCRHRRSISSIIWEIYHISRFALILVQGS